MISARAIKEMISMIIKNRTELLSHGNKRGREAILEVLKCAINVVDIYEATKKSVFIKNNDLHIKDLNYDLSKIENIYVIGGGKATFSAAKALDEVLGERIKRGCINIKGNMRKRLKQIKVIEAGHPIPNERGYEGAREIMDIAKEAKKSDLVFCVITGGASALMPLPAENIALEDKKKVTDQLLKCGATISEINTVRKHISRVKGGRLAEIAYPSRVISLILSDVIGDRLDIIASGPTSPDNTTYQDALRVLVQYKLIDTSPRSVVGVLERGIKGLLPETPKGGSPIFEKANNIIIGSNKKALAGAKTEAEKLLHVEILSSEITGEARDVGKWLAQKAKEIKSSRSSNRPLCLISGGETTVTVKGNGIGGRNMELALSFAMEIEGIEGITLLSAGTDGTDGPTDAAGAIVDGQTEVKARATGVSPEEYLRNNDSYNFFKKIDGLFITGPTGTNVMDVQIVVIE